MSDSRTISVDADFPGGNIIVEGIEGDRIRVRPDLRDTEGWWFYWYFRVRGAEGRTIEVVFGGERDPIGARGPAVSLDGGESWHWLDAACCEERTFSYAVPPNASEVRFCFSMPYSQANLERFLARLGERDDLVLETLCETRKGRKVELLHFGALGEDAAHRVLLTCRHHACEMMANYAAEGIVEEVLLDDEAGAWRRGRVAFLLVPFVDKDGVEDGDQGKNRRPRDHNRDYAGESIHPSTAALRRYIPEWSRGRLHVSLDMHCPWISREVVYFPGLESEKHSRALAEFSRILEEVQTSPLGFSAADNLPFGQGWNTAANYAAGKSCARWCSELPENWLAASLEIPYAETRGVEVNGDSARALGRDLARAIGAFLQAADA